MSSIGGSQIVTHLIGILETIKFRFVHTNTFCKYRKNLRASPRVNLVKHGTVCVTLGTSHFIKI